MELLVAPEAQELPEEQGIVDILQGMIEGAAGYQDIPTDDGTLRILYEMSIGDLLVASFIGLLLLFLILNSLMKIVWRR